MEEKKQEVSLLVGVEGVGMFSDNVLFEAKEDVVCLNFVQSIPNPGGNGDKPMPQAKLVSRIFLTIPHFMRFAGVCEKMAAQIKETPREASK